MDDIDLEEHLRAFKLKQSTKFRNIVLNSIRFSLARYNIKHVSLNHIIQYPKNIAKQQTSSKKKKKIRDSCLDLPNLHPLFDFLSKHASENEIFRKPGQKGRTANLESKIDNGDEIEWEEVNVLDAADLLKRYVRCLRNPLVPEESQKYHKGLAIANGNGGMEGDEFVNALQMIFICLPHENRQLLIKLFVLLEHAIQVQTNPESAAGLATIFLPCIFPSFTPPELRLAVYQNHLKFIIQNWSTIRNPPQIILQELRRLCPDCTLSCPFYEPKEKLNHLGPLSNIRRRYQRWRNKPTRKKQFRSTLPRDTSSPREIASQGRRSNSFAGPSSAMPRI